MKLKQDGKKSHMLPKTCLQRVFCIPSDTFYFSVWNYKSAMKTDFARVIRVNLCDGTCQRISTTIWGLPVNQKLMQTNSVTKCVYKQTTVVFWQTCNCVLPNWMQTTQSQQSSDDVSFKTKWGNFCTLFSQRVRKRWCFWPVSRQNEVVSRQNEETSVRYFLKGFEKLMLVFLTSFKTKRR